MNDRDLARREKLFALMHRYAALGRLLPAADDFEEVEDRDIPQLRMVLLEMEVVRRQIDALMSAYQEPPWTGADEETWDQKAN